MVSLNAIRASNEQLGSALPAGMVAVFIGATSGIGETTMKQFVKHANAPRVYFVGRTASWGERIKTELKSLNPNGTYSFMQCDASLLKSVDEVCREIKSKETAINLLFESMGTLVIGTKTAEDLHYFAALAYYSRIRFVVNLLPLIQAAPALRRVVTVFAGGKEGPIATDDFPGHKVSLQAGRGHFASMLTLSLEVLAAKAPEVSFIHDYPGFVKTDLMRGTTGVGMAILKGISKVIAPLFSIPTEEAGARFPPASGDAKGVPSEGIGTAAGTDGKIGSGVYAVHVDGETKVPEVLSKLRQDGTKNKLWKHTEEEFIRVTGSVVV